jgi:DNA-binding NarL/FixJ family response regulator
MILTDREKEVLELMANDLNKEEIALKMKLSKRTIEGYQDKIRARMGVKMLYTALFKFGQFQENVVLERNSEKPS